MKKSLSSRYKETADKILDRGETPATPDSPPPRAAVLGKRQKTIEAVSSGKMKRIKLFEHDPQRIRPWAGHNRDYQALSEERCRDLIDSMRRAGQQFPAVVRKVEGEEGVDFELICGARRHWTAAYLQRDLLVEVRALDDRQAFILQDIENRDREDVSDYERAVDYRRALTAYFDNNRTRMAEQLQIDRGNFSRFLMLADMPAPIVEAYGDLRDLVVHHGTTYHKLLKDNDARRRMLATAGKLKGEGLPGKDVLVRIRDAASDTPVRQRAPTPRVKKSKALTVVQGRGGQYTVKFSVPKTATAQDLSVLRQELLAMLEDIAPSAAPNNKVTETKVAQAEPA